ncbi:MAG: acetyl-CoA carboxylase biotin carboxyl carrier protein [Candidatus Methylomirabilia bacterium]
MAANEMRRDRPRLREIKALIDLAAARGLTELEVSWGDIRVKIRRESPTPAAAPSGRPTLPAPETTAAERLETPAAQTVAVEAPMVGTFYRAPSPGADPYVTEGDAIKQGQVLCIIEAMKLMNEIESKVAGRIVNILVENNQPVEYGQPLFLVEPHS